MSEFTWLFNVVIAASVATLVVVQVKLFKDPPVSK
jgi:hypothetical protein